MGSEVRAFGADGGFDVEPATIAAGAKPLADAAQASSNYGLFAAVHTETAADAVGAGSLDDALRELGAKLGAKATELEGMLEATGAALEATAAAYTASDRPLAPDPLTAAGLSAPPFSPPLIP